MAKLIFTLSLLLILVRFGAAQERCATEKFDSIRRKNNPYLETKNQFEQWISSKIKKSNSSGLRTGEAGATYTIPVVVHIIHNGTGSAFNISDDQVLSQIKVLNNDFQRLNADATQTPTEFQPVAASMSIQFVLAKQDPQGNATTGIVRVNGGKSPWNLYEDTELKAKSYWPAEQYFNIWVTNFSQYLGYTQFPVSNLQGLNNSSNDRLTDGIIVHYRAFGSIDDGAFDLESQYNKGRTLTHETGHFLGLRHVWGDATSCGATDYVNDTPPQIGSTANCPTHPVKECSSLAKMFQNYLDYTDDQCMNIFTAGQVSRMIAVLESSPRRASLLTSPGALPPGNFALDLAITSVEVPTTLECSGVHTPSITIRNYGTTIVTAANIELKINGSTVQTKTVTLTLGSLQQTQVTFNDYTSAAQDSKTFQFKILTVNGVADENLNNNTYSLTTKTATNTSPPFIETFETTLTKWNVVNPDELTGWSQVTLPASSGKAIYMRNYDYEYEGAVDKIYSPAFNVSASTGLLLKFKLAYAQYPGNVGDALSVYAFTGCADDLSTGTRVFFEEGSTLGTTTSTGTYFTPTLADWETKYVPLNQFIGTSNLRLAFVSRNGYGNNVYIDDVELIGETVTNLAIQKVLEPSWAVCESPITIKLEMANLGTQVINGYTINITKNGIALPVQNMPAALNPGEVTEVSLSPISLGNGANTITLVASPNGATDSSPADNTVSLPVSLITNSVAIPARENFNATSTWAFVNAGAHGWTTAPTNYSISSVFESFSNPNLGEESWLVSPKLDLTKAIEASLFADFSYAYRDPFDDFISVEASADCGKTFSEVLFSAPSADLTNLTSSSYWIPGSADDWTKKYFNLDNYAGLNNVLIAIKATNFNGNNLYLDNIEFFENDDINPPVISDLFRIWTGSSLSETYLTFNLPEKQTAQVQVASIMGSEILNITLSDALNQTLTLQPNVAPGIYIFKVRIGNSLSVVKQYMENLRHPHLEFWEKYDEKMVSPIVSI